MQKPPSKILLVDDDPQSLESTRKLLELSGFEVAVAGDGLEALEVLRSQGEIALIVSDVRMPKMTGLEFLKAVASSYEVPVVLMTAFGRVEDAVWAMKWGAVDFLTKPFKRKTLLDAVKSALARQAPAGGKRAAAGEAAVENEDGLLGRSSAMNKLRELILQVAPTAATCLIQGESGVGKEKVAQLIHELSARKKGPFIAINCAALPENLLEAELFGYERGAFTGAGQAKAGLFESANGGTLFLDEIGDMPFSLQAKLLRVLQEGEVRRLGATVSRKIDARILSATHQDLKAKIQAGAFRADLLFRLEVVPLDVPPLRARLDDVAILAEVFVARSSARHGKTVAAISPEAMRALAHYAWPGNVRELQNVVERAVIFAKDDRIDVEDLPAHVLELQDRDLGLGATGAGAAASGGGTISVPIGTPLREVEDLMIRKTLELTHGDKNVTAKLLGINSRTIYRKLKEDEA